MSIAMPNGIVFLFHGGGCPCGDAGFHAGHLSSCPVTDLHVHLFNNSYHILLSQTLTILQLLCEDNAEIWKSVGSICRQIKKKHDTEHN